MKKYEKHLVVFLREEAMTSMKAALINAQLRIKNNDIEAKHKVWCRLAEEQHKADRILETPRREL